MAIWTTLFLCDFSSLGTNSAYIGSSQPNYVPYGSLYYQLLVEYETQYPVHCAPFQPTHVHSLTHLPNGTCTDTYVCVYIYGPTYAAT
jgi:hypothetical protein